MTGGSPLICCFGALRALNTPSDKGRQGTSQMMDILAELCIVADNMTLICLYCTGREGRFEDAFLPNLSFVALVLYFHVHNVRLLRDQL